VPDIFLNCGKAHIYHFNQFKVYNLVTLSSFQMPTITAF
jgi:hypothetical protein